MVIFDSYVSLPEGNDIGSPQIETMILSTSENVRANNKSRTATNLKMWVCHGVSENRKLP